MPHLEGKEREDLPSFMEIRDRGIKNKWNKCVLITEEIEPKTLQGIIIVSFSRVNELEGEKFSISNTFVCSNYEICIS